MSEVITYREFTSPHQYNYGDCMVKDTVQYQCINVNGVNGRFILADWRVLSSGGGGTGNGYFPQGWG